MSKPYWNTLRVLKENVPLCAVIREFTSNWIHKFRHNSFQKQRLNNPEVNRPYFYFPSSQWKMSIVCYYTEVHKQLKLLPMLGQTFSIFYFQTCQYYFIHSWNKTEFLFWSLKMTYSHFMKSKQLFFLTTKGIQRSGCSIDEEKKSRLNFIIDPETISKAWRQSLRQSVWRIMYIVQEVKMYLYL